MVIPKRFVSKTKYILYYFLPQIEVLSCLDMSLHKKKPIIAISSGDPAGISPEIIAANFPFIAKYCSPIVFGHWPSIERATKGQAQMVPITLVNEPTLPREGAISFVHCGPEGDPIDLPGPDSAIAQIKALDRAIDACLSHTCDCLVTAPVAKNLISTVCPDFKGHTEHLAVRCGLEPDDVTMVFASNILVVGLVTTHLPLRDISSLITKARVERTVQHVKALIARMKPSKKPRIAVAALNPHAGESGLLGTEEVDILNPLCIDLKKDEDINLSGPIPADAVFLDAIKKGLYDGVVSMYHDQAMIPLKLLGIGSMTNVTMGLPFIRTSPNHGVAYDIAGKGLADPSGMKSAIEMAISLT